MGFINRAKASGGHLNGYLGPGTEIEGIVRFTDVLRVDGKITGRILSEKDLIVGETGEVEGEIEVGTLSVAGRVHGNVTIQARMEIHEGGRVTGDLILGTRHLVVEDGGAFEGNIRMGDSAIQSATDEAPLRVAEFPARGGSE
jgi:cytoskeletal protein CcmA (bactofilin family)